MLVRWFESCKDAKINFYIGSGFYGDGLYFNGAKIFRINCMGFYCGAHKKNTY